MKKIATDSVQSAILRDMIGAASADMYIDTNYILDSGTKNERYYLGVLIGLSDIDYENMDKHGLIPAYTLDALIDIICRGGAWVDFYHTYDFLGQCGCQWVCRWSKRVKGMGLVHLSRIGKTKVDAAFEVVVALYKEGYIEKDHAER